MGTRFRGVYFGEGIGDTERPDYIQLHFLLVPDEPCFVIHGEYSGRALYVWIGACSDA